MLDLDTQLYVSLLLTTIIPLIMGILCYLIDHRYARYLFVSIGTISAIIGSIMLFNVLYATSGHIIDYNPPTIPLGSFNLSFFDLISILDVILMIGFILLAVAIRSYLSLLFAVLQFIPLVWYEFVYKPPVAATPVFIDYWSGIMCLIISIVGSLIVLYALEYMDDTYKKRNRFFAYMVGFLGAMNGAVFSNELLWFFFFWEITTLACYMLIKHEETEEAMGNAKWALELNLGGGLGMACAIVFMGVQFKITTFKELLETNSFVALTILGIALISFAALVKSAQVPFQSWLLGAMVAPTPVSALLHSSTMVKLGVYLIVRISPVFHDIQFLGYTLSMIGGFSFVATAVLAISQTNAKKVLAYSTIGNLGLIIMLAGIDSSLAISAAIILTIFHAISKAMLFLGVGVVQHESHSKDIENMEGIMFKKPFIATIILCGIMTMIIPPFGVFLGKYLAVQAAVGFPYVAFFLAFGSAATIAYYVKWLGRMLSSESDIETKSEKMGKLFSVPLSALLFLAVSLSVLIVPVVHYLINPTIKSMGFAAALEADSIIGITTPVGFFSSLMIAIFLVVVLIIPYTLKLDRQKLTKPYSSGVEFETKLSGMYLEDYVGEKRANIYVNSVGIALVLELLLLAGLVYTMGGV
jgi:ech hydrogenase subunit A